MGYNSHIVDALYHIQQAKCDLTAYSAKSHGRKEEARARLERAERELQDAKSLVSKIGTRR